MQILTKERFIFALIIVILTFVIAYGAIWFNGNYTLMPVEREKIENVENCIDNNVACGLIYSSEEEIPD